MKNTGITAYDLSTRVVSYDADMGIMHPNRHHMISVALEVFPFDPNDVLLALELGGGTGVFTQAFLEKYPRSRVIYVDGSESMIELAKVRLGKWAEKVDFRLGDFRYLQGLLRGEERGLAVFSSYALHHLTPEDKLSAVRQSIGFLKPGGWFLNADLIISPYPEIEERIQQIRVDGIVRRAKGKGKRFKNAISTRQHLDDLEAEDGDQPLTLQEDLAILEEAGFRDVSSFWQEYRETVYGGRK